MEPPHHREALLRLRQHVGACTATILAGFAERLRREDNPLGSLPDDRLAEIVVPIVAVLRHGDPTLDHVSSEVGRSRAHMLINPVHSLNAAGWLFEATADVIESGAAELDSPRELPAMLLRELHDVIHRRVTTAAIPYAAVLLGQITDAQANERIRIARELHDRSAHALALGLQQLDIRRVHLDRGDEESAENALVCLRDQLRVAVDMIRDLAEDLGTTYTDKGLDAALAEYVETHGQGRVTLNVEHPKAVAAVPTWVREQAFLAIREATRNALLHSGADTITANLAVRYSALVARVDDNGCGIPDLDPQHASSGTGLRSLSERIEQIGGTATITSTAGTTVELIVPLP